MRPVLEQFLFLKSLDGGNFVEILMNHSNFIISYIFYVKIEQNHRDQKSKQKKLAFMQ